MVRLHPPGSPAVVVVSEEQSKRYLAQGWRRADSTPVRGFEPAEHTVAEVREHLEVSSHAERQRVMAAERSGRARKRILGD